MDKLNELGTGEKLISAGGVVLFIASFLPWYRGSDSVQGIGVPYSYTGWENPGALFSILAALIGLVLAFTVLGPRFGGAHLPQLGAVTWPQAQLGGGGAALALVVLKFLLDPGTVSYGFFIGFLAAAALAAGGYLLFSREQGAQSFWSNRR